MVRPAPVNTGEGLNPEAGPTAADPQGCTWYAERETPGVVMVTCFDNGYVDAGSMLGQRRRRWPNI